MVSFPRKTRAFTLVELLVVIGIIALLIAMLMPALSRARQQSQRVVCMSSLRQMGISVRLYAHDHKGMVPSWRSIPKRTIWPWVVGNKYTAGDGKLAAGKQLLCPINPWRDDGWSESWAYNENAQYWLHFLAAKNASTIFFAGDAYKGDGSTSRLLMENMTAPGTGPTLYYEHANKTATLLFVDGHVEARRQEEVPVWRDRGVTAAIKVWREPGYNQFWVGMKGF